MSKKLPPERMAKAAGPLTDVQTQFIQIHLARGATPKVIRETMNRLAVETKEDIARKFNIRGLRTQGQHGRTWANLGGTRQVTQADVRRVYDALRKSPGSLNESRKAALAKFKVDDARSKAVLGFNKLTAPNHRKLHDLGFARRFGADREALSKLEESALSVGYFTGDMDGGDVDHPQEERTSTDLLTDYLKKLAEEEQGDPNDEP